MALDYYEKRTLANALRTYAEAHPNTDVTLAQLRTATNTDYASQSYIAQMSSIYSRIDRGLYHISKYITIDSILKERDNIIFKCGEEIINKYNFTAGTYDNEIGVCSWDTNYDYQNIYLHIGEYAEWIFNYMDMLDFHSLIESNTSCPKGYIDWCKENDKLIGTYTLNEYNDYLIVKGAKDVETAKKLLNYMHTNYSYRNQVGGIELTEEIINNIQALIVKYSDKIKFAIDHEYITEFYENIGSTSWGTNKMDTTYKLFMDYLLLCTVMNEEPIFKNTLKNFAIIKQMYNIKKNESMNENLAKYNNSKLAFENDDFVVIVPTTYAEFKAEADYQQNCVCAYYAPKVSNNETNVVFIRRKSDIEKPYITCEVSKTNRINQYLTRFNNSVEDECGKAFEAIYRNYLRTL